MAGKPDRTTLICGALTTLMGGVFALQGLGAIPAPQANDDGPRWLLLCIGAIFGLGGIAAMLTTMPGRTTRAVNAALAFVIVVCMGAVAGWVAWGPGSRGFSSPLALFGPQASEAGGRFLFGGGAVGCALFALAMVWRPVQAWASSVRSAYWPPLRKR